MIHFKGGYKYQLAEEYRVHIEIKPEQSISHKWFSLSNEGELWIAAGYAWDGPSGPVPDHPTNMRASLVHDVLYQMMRHNLLDGDEHRKTSDEIMRRHLREDGTGRVDAFLIYWGLRLFAEYASTAEYAKKTLTSPAIPISS